MTSTEFFDALEARDPLQREAAQMAALSRQVAHAQAHSRALAETLAGVDASAVTSRAALAQLPVLRKSELQARQQAARARTPRDGLDAFGGFSTLAWGAGVRPARRVFQSPGGIYEPEGDGPDYWRMARALHAAGVRAGELLHNSFSYHLTPAAAMLEGSAQALGCAVFAGGVGNTELQLQAVQDLRPSAYAGTPSFLKILVDKAEEGGLRLSFAKALVSGEAFPAALRDWLDQRGVAGYQCYATADVGLIAYETRAREGLVVDEGVIVEIVRPGSGDPVPDGEVGEVLVTVLQPDYPLIRLATGDLSAVLPGRCPTGRSNTRLRGWLGRADQSAKVRGMFVHAGQVAEVLARCGQRGRARLVVDGELANDRMWLQLEADVSAPGLAEQLQAALRDVTKLRGEVELVAPGSLPNDGHVIEDRRSV